MDTAEIMTLAMKLARQTKLPEDSEIYVPASSVRRAMFGIDADVGTVLAAKSLGYDLFIAHHPLGGAASLGIVDVYAKHATNLVRAGVPRKAALAAVRAMQDEHGPRVHALNYDHVPSLARELGMALMSIHNPCDEIGRRIMDETLRRAVKRSTTIGRAISVLNQLPEFRAAKTEIKVRMGSPRNRLGRWVVLHGAGTNGGYHVAKAAFDNGVDTVVYIHIDPGHLARLRSEFASKRKNLIVTGHIASDSIGINLLVRALRERGLEVTCVSGILEG